MALNMKVQMPYTGVAVHRLNGSQVQVTYYQGDKPMVAQTIECRETECITLHPSGLLNLVLV